MMGMWITALSSFIYHVCGFLLFLSLSSLLSPPLPSPHPNLSPSSLAYRYTLEEERTFPKILDRVNKHTELDSLGCISFLQYSAGNWDVMLCQGHYGFLLK